MAPFYSKMACAISTVVTPTAQALICIALVGEICLQFGHQAKHLSTTCEAEIGWQQALQ
jgi:hypothetical protein